MKLVLFDCDDTIWEAHGDYVSSVPSTFSVTKNSIVRQKDQAQFTIKPGLYVTIKSLHKKGILVGVVSDNIKEPVIEALTLCGLMPFICTDAINIRLWKGPCPKQIMVQEILDKPFAKNIKPQDVLWLDDKDYSKEAVLIGVNFYHVQKKYDKKIKELLKSL